MIVDGILPFARKLISTHVNEDSIVIDATAGNGNDTLFLAKLVPNGHVYAFDIQEIAIENTRRKTSSYKNISYHNIGHQHAASIIKKKHASVDVAIFNLGYLPKGDKSITTTSDTTITAIENLFEIIKRNGIIILVIYPGHQEGQIESHEVYKYVQQIDQQKAHVLTYQFINQKNNPPYIVAIEKRI